MVCLAGFLLRPVRPVGSEIQSLSQSKGVFALAKKLRHYVDPVQYTGVPA